jgi:membrane protein DedA with SNARE-associated domain
MNLATFVLYTAIGSAIWNTALVTAGYLLREQWHDVEPVLDTVQYVVVAALVGVIVWFVWSRRRSAQTATTDR